MTLLCPFKLTKEASGMSSPTPWSIEVEYMELIYHLLRSLKCKTVLEVGTAMGHSTWWLSHAVDAVQTIDSNLDKTQIVQETKDRRNIQYQHINARNFFKEVSPRLFDAILLDGDHSYEETIFTLKTAYSVLRPGGVILVHDTAQEPVLRAVNECKYLGKWVHYPHGKGLSYVYKAH